MGASGGHVPLLPPLGSGTVDFNTIYSVNNNALIDTRVFILLIFPKGASTFLHTSLKPDVNTAQHTEYDGGSLRNVLTVVSFEDLPHWYSLAKIHAFGLEL